MADTTQPDDAVDDLPTPDDGETGEAYLARFAADPTAADVFPDPDERAAAAREIWDAWATA